MPDIISPADRALIDAYPKRRIQRVPMGACSPANDWIWDEKAKRIRSSDTRKWTPWGRKKTNA